MSENGGGDRWTGELTGSWNSGEFPEDLQKSGGCRRRKLTERFLEEKPFRLRDLRQANQAVKRREELEKIIAGFTFAERRVHTGSAAHSGGSGGVRRSDPVRGAGNRENFRGNDLFLRGGSFGHGTETEEKKRLAAEALKNAETDYLNRKVKVEGNEAVIAALATAQLSGSADGDPEALSQEMTTRSRIEKSQAAEETGRRPLQAGEKPGRGGKDRKIVGKQQRDRKTMVSDEAFGGYRRRNAAEAGKDHAGNFRSDGLLRPDSPPGQFPPDENDERPV